MNPDLYVSRSFTTCPRAYMYSVPTKVILESLQFVIEYPIWRISPYDKRMGPFCWGSNHWDLNLPCWDDVYESPIQSHNF